MFGRKKKAAAQAASPIFLEAYSRAFTLYKRCKLCAEQGMLDASAFYMRKTLEVIATSFIDEYERLGMGQPFVDFCLKKGHLGPKGTIAPTLDDKVDYLLQQNNIPAESEKAYDAIRQYGNAAVHEAAFAEDPKQNAKMLKLLESELLQFYEMAKG
ncbi:MAG: DUF4145 domain-containing protein [Eggerthellales bacterium]|nr:DUF4145 domain-containing protein [Eggerthellales bacterium]